MHVYVNVYVKLCVFVFMSDVVCRCVCVSVGVCVCVLVCVHLCVRWTVRGNRKRYRGEVLSTCVGYSLQGMPSGMHPVVDLCGRGREKLQMQCVYLKEAEM